MAAVEEHWQRAFFSGDTAYLEELLEPSYVSVNRHGTPRDRATVIALSRSMARASASVAASAPPPQIDVRDHAAIVTASSHKERSVDVFHYDGGRWHAWYSQHTGIDAPQAAGDHDAPSPGLAAVAPP